MRTDLVSDEEVDKFLKQNYGYNPRLEDFMLDLMSAAPMAMGFPMPISGQMIGEAFGKGVQSRFKGIEALENLPKDFFPTTGNPAKRMIDFVTEGGTRDIGKALEPHGGEGHLAKLIKKVTGKQINILELNPERVSKMQKAGLPAKLGNFLEHKETYDSIIMNPPFSGGQAKLHILHAIDLLNEGGKGVSIVPAREIMKGQPLRRWIESAKNVELLGDTKLTIPGEGKSVSAAIVGFTK